MLTFADRMTHMSHRFTLTALRSALLSGDPCIAQARTTTQAREYSYVQYRDFGKVLKCLPFSPQIVNSAHNDHMLELMVVEVGSSERHDQVPESYQWTVGVGEETHHHMTIEHGHRCLVAVLNLGIFLK